MSLFAHPDFDDHEHVSYFSDPPAGLRAIIAIHRTGVLGSAGGGCRLWPYVDEAAALRDALRLSRAMTYKLALVELPVGGAKCVVWVEPGAPKTPALLQALGRVVDRLAGRFIVSEDVGTTPDDLAALRAVTPWVDPSRDFDTAEATAYGVFVGLRTAVRRRLGRDRLAGLTVAVQGLGRVGRALCRHLHDAGARLFVADLDRARTDELHRLTDAIVVPPAAIFEQPAEIFAPCALGDVFDSLTVASLVCRVIAGSANNQLADARQADALAARGILYVPDFALNVGGALAAASGIGGDRSGLRARLDGIAGLVDGICSRAEREGTSTHVAAERTARERLAALGARP